jgi:hypothetical protein
MKFSTIIASLSLLFLGSVSISASAQTSVCTWRSVYGHTSNNITYISHICQLPSSTTVASRTDSYYITWGYYSCGTPNVSAGYQNTGIKQGTQYPAQCNDIITGSGVASSSAASSSAPANVCYTGEYQIIQTGPSYTPFNPAFCGPQPQCKHVVTVLDPFQQYPRLKYTCL